MKNKLVYFLVVLSITSLYFNFKLYNEKQKHTNHIIRKVYKDLITIERTFDAFKGMEKKDAQSSYGKLTYISSLFLDINANLNFLSYENKEMMYSEGVYSFRTISENIFTILEDNMISDKEFEYLNLLSTFIKTLIEELNLAVEFVRDDDEIVNYSTENLKVSSLSRCILDFIIDNKEIFLYSLNN
ncbi:hypothetical protein ACR77J_01935 [Tissierella praeacuta]|uniref:hypothetical protein n=1 Tax=Tissierella praeacuta TaxID=43131 RepID=UPI003DA479F9